jgi:hypothetical protein
MGDLEDSVQRHPAGNARKETIWDTAWAISKAMQVGREQEQERIIKLLEELAIDIIVFSRDNALIDQILDQSRKQIIAAIKGENNGPCACNYLYNT